MKTITFELSSAIKYANGSGQEVEANFIELSEPTGKVTHLCCEIESLIQSSLLSMSSSLDESVLEQAKEDAKNKTDDQNSDLTGEVALSMMVSGGADMRKMVVIFRELFKIVGMMGGEKPLTMPRMDDMSHKDFKNMMGEYAANFIMG